MLPTVLPDDTLRAAEALLATLRTRGLRLATAESCTGGLLSAALTSVPGSSSTFDRGFVTYSYEAKSDQLGVPADLVVSQGAVSAEVAAAMAEGALAHSNADLAVAITGIAGPGGGTEQKPVGLVYFATCRRGSTARAFEEHFSGDRTAIRAASVARALELLADEAKR